MLPCDFLLRDAASGRWLRFERPLAVLVAAGPGDVPAVLRRVDAELAAGRWAAGFLAYEAAPALDPSLTVRDDPDFPAAVFGIYETPVAENPPPPPEGGTSPPVADLVATMDEGAYRLAIAAVHEAIREGDTYQVNFTYRLRGRLETSASGAGRLDVFDPSRADDAARRLFVHLAAGQAAGYAAYARVGRWAIASASPELHFARAGDRLWSRPMKGTARRERGPADRDALEALVRSRKERAENLMIVDMVRNDLARVARPGSVIVTSLFTAEAYPTVWQLTSLVEARSAEPLSALMAALFPAASITGAPKGSTMERIARLETTPRRVYCGSIGFAGPDGTAQFNVAIRTALVDLETGEVEYGIGGGIVWDSDAGREWAESRAKAAILTRTSPAYDLLETLRWDPYTGYRLLEAHLERLGTSALALGFPDVVEPARAALDEWARTLERALVGEPRRVRLTSTPDGLVGVTDEPLRGGPAFDRPRLAIAPAALSSADPFLCHKTTHRAAYDAMRALVPDADDIVLWNERGEVTETTWANVFVERHGVLVTPPLSCGLLAGTLRAELLASGRAVEELLCAEDLLRGDPVWLGNSVRGLYRAGPVRDARPRTSLTV